MDLDELREVLSDAGNRIGVNSTGARTAVDARARLLRRRRRAIALVGAAAVVALVGGTVAVASAHGQRRVDTKPMGPTPDSVLPTSVPPPATNPSPSTTVEPGVVDPLPAGSLMLQVSYGTISVVDA